MGVVLAVPVLFSAVPVLLYWVAEKWLKVNPNEYVMRLGDVVMSSFTEAARSIIEGVALLVNSLFTYFSYSVTQLLEHAVIVLLMLLAILVLAGMNTLRRREDIGSVFKKFLFVIAAIVLGLSAAVSGVTYFGLQTWLWSAVPPAVVAIKVAFDKWQSMNSGHPGHGDATHA
ncbi:MAG: hypothetical protein Q8R36_03335 [bacterium]|nr:hypothetical protein [bacterium]